MSPDQNNEFKTKQAADLLAQSSRAVAFTGAGISTPSGIPDFRTSGSGLWSRQDPMQVASLTAFNERPHYFYAWLRPLAIAMRAAKPNPAHYALAKMEALHIVQAIITQNIDNLHQRAGSKRVIELHGSLLTMTCPKCGCSCDANPFRLTLEANGEIPLCPVCDSILKPDIVLYEELLPEYAWVEAESACRKADVLLVAGTSLEVTPASWLPDYGLDNGAKLVIINRERTPLDDRADVVLRGDAAGILPAIVNQLNGNKR